MPSQALHLSGLDYWGVTPEADMLKHSLAVLTGVLLCGALDAQTYGLSPTGCSFPPDGIRSGKCTRHCGKQRGEVYVSVETQGMGVQVFSSDGRYLRSLDKAPPICTGRESATSGTVSTSTA